MLGGSQSLFPVNCFWWSRREYFRESVKVSKEKVCRAFLVAIVSFNASFRDLKSSGKLAEGRNQADLETLRSEHTILKRSLATLMTLYEAGTDGRALRKIACNALAIANKRTSMNHYCSREHPENITRGPVARFDTGVWHATLAGQECSTRASEIASWLHVLSHQRIEKLLGLLVVPVGGSERACNVDHWQCSTHMPIHMPWWYVCICASLFEGDPSNNQKASVQLLLRVIDL